MTNEELALAYQDGDEEALAELLAQNEALIYQAAQAKCDNQNLADLRQEGRIALIKAAKTFDPAYETKFTTHLHWTMQGHLSKVVFRKKTYRRLQFVTDVAPKEDDRFTLGEGRRSSMHYLDGFPAKEDRRYLPEEVRQAIVNLPRVYREIIEARLLDKTLQEISEERGVSKQRVQQLEAVAHELLYKLVKSS